MTLRLADITQLLADKVPAELVGNPDLMIDRLSTLEASGPNDLTFLSNPKYLGQLAQSRAGCVVVLPAARDAALKRGSCIVVDGGCRHQIERAERVIDRGEAGQRRGSRGIEKRFVGTVQSDAQSRAAA